MIDTPIPFALSRVIDALKKASETKTKETKMPIETMIIDKVVSAYTNKGIPAPNKKAIDMLQARPANKLIQILVRLMG